MGYGESVKVTVPPPSPPLYELSLRGVVKQSIPVDWAGYGYSNKEELQVDCPECKP